MKKLLFLVCFLALAGCAPTQTKSVSIKEAYTDGFRAVVFTQSSIYADELKKSEEKIKTIPEATFLLPADKIPEIEKQIKQAFDPDSTYPFIGIKIEQKEKIQIVDLSFHDSNSTIHYCYEAENKKIKPLWCSFNSLGAKRKTFYNKDL